VVALLDCEVTVYPVRGPGLVAGGVVWERSAASVPSCDRGAAGSAAGEGGWVAGGGWARDGQLVSELIAYW